VDVRIGLVNGIRDLEIEVPDDTDLDAFKSEIDDALAGEKVLWIVDKRGNRIAVHAARVTYVQIGAGDHGRIGFGA